MLPNQNLPKPLLFALAFVGVCAAALLLAASSAANGRLHWREAATIILFIPLIWSFLRLRPRGMVLAGLILATVRVAVEWLQHRSVGRDIGVGESIQEALFPLGLYTAMGVMFHLYRLRQAILVGQLVQASALETRQQMASRLAHDFNNVLTVVSGTAQLIYAQAPPGSQTARDAQSILDSSEQGMRLVREMMSVSQDQPLQEIPCELSEVVAQQMKMIRRILPPSVQVAQEFSPVPLPVKADPGRLLRVLTNLCLNARQAMPNGGQLTVRTALEPGGPPQALLEIQDTGCGIPPKAMRQLFTPFFTTRRQSGGTGLGLSIVKSIIQEHGGKILVTSTPGQGACFRILLPIAQ